MTTQPTPRPLAVTMLHNYRETGQMSMKLYADQLGAALSGLGVEVDHFRPGNVLPDALARRPLLAKADSYYGRFARYPAAARKLRGELFHIVDHAQSYLLGAVDPGRTVVTCHDLILLLVAAGRVQLEMNARIATRIFRSAIRRMAGARFIVVVSENTRRDLAEFAEVDPDKVVVIHPGLNYPFVPGSDAEREQARARLGLPPGPLVLQVGQNTFYKNIPGCLRVIARLRRGGLPVRYVRLGKPLLPDHRTLATQLGVDDALIELGPRSPEDLAAAYRACDVLLFPSLYEGFGWPPIEAMASGLPVVCSRAGSLGEVVGDAALTAEPEDVSQLADHVSALLERPALAQELRRRGLERSAHFDWSRAARAMLGVYQRVRGS